MMGRLVKEDLAVNFDSIEDPRLDRTKKYPICEIIFLSIFGALWGVESWRGLETLGEERLDDLRNYFPFKHGIPSHQTIARVFSLLKPKSFEDFFIIWTANLNGTNDGKQIALDGKTLRGSYDKASGKQALHLLHACAVESGITLAQMEVGPKTNEITTVPAMLDALDIKGAMISVDALNTQKEIASKIVDADANYTMALKGNHKNLNREVATLFSTNQTQITEQNQFAEVEKGHGRVTERTYSIIEVNGKNLPQKGAWKGLESVGRVEVKVWKDSKETNETRFYLLSYADVKLFAKSSRGHWGVESMHWTLDVTFSEDSSRKRKDHAPRNYSLIRKFALNALRTFKGRLSVPNAQIKCAANRDFLNTVLQGVGFKRLAQDLI